MAAQEEAAGLAALSICESLLIALVEKGVLSADEVRGTLEDAAAAHQGQLLADGPRARHELAGQIIERLANQMNAVRQGGER